jgi:hypothetical protein
VVYDLFREFDQYELQFVSEDI